jgi:hypothetical protein
MTAADVMVALDAVTDEVPPELQAWALAVLDAAGVTHHIAFAARRDVPASRSQATTWARYSSTSASARQSRAASSTQWASGVVKGYYSYSEAFGGRYLCSKSGKYDKWVRRTGRVSSAIQRGTEIHEALHRLEHARRR